MHADGSAHVSVSLEKLKVGLSQQHTPPASQLPVAVSCLLVWKKATHLSVSQHL